MSRRALPTFVLIGAMKAGTTSLYHYLGAHPEIYVPPTKEPDFFSVDEIWDRGVDWYAELYGPGASARARGDCSPSYAMRGQYPSAAARMATVLPDARIVFLVRHPLERIRSMWIHHAFTGRERRPLVDAVRADARYVDTSRYAWQLGAYLEAFALERITVVSAERLRTRRSETMTQILDGVGVAPADVGPGVEHHVSATKRLPYGLRENRPWREHPRWPPDRRGRVVQRLTTRSLAAKASALPATFEQELWERLAPDLVALAAIVGRPALESWGWRTSAGVPVTEML